MIPKGIPLPAKLGYLTKHSLPLKHPLTNYPQALIKKPKFPKHMDYVMLFVQLHLTPLNRRGITIVNMTWGYSCEARPF